MPAGRRGVVDQASDHPPAGAITHPAGGHPPRWRTGGSVPIAAVPLSMSGQPISCRRPRCAPGFVDAPTRGPVRGSAPAGWEGAAGSGAADGSRGNTSPRGLLAVVRGVVLREALDELVDGAGLGQAALAGLVGQLVLGQALVALTGLVVGLLALPRGLPGLLPLGLLGRLTGLGLDPLRLLSLVAGRPLEGVDAAAGGVGDALHLLAHGAADRLDLLAGDASQRVGNLGQGAGVLVVEVHDPLDEGELPLDAVGGVELRKGVEGREGPELVGDGAHATLPALQRAGEQVLTPAGGVSVVNRDSQVVLQA